MRPSLGLFLALVLVPFACAATKQPDHWPTPPATEDPSTQVSGPLTGGTADHTKFEELKQPFTSGPEVTKACLKCHTEAGRHFMKNIHWTWEYRSPDTGQLLGKRHLINNFCTNARGNEGMCAQCHAGYGWKDESFDFTNETNIDCLVCHDNTGTYFKMPNSPGNKACAVMFEGKPKIDLSLVAQSVGLPERANCGACHFYGGGGDNVKHGDLSSALKQPTRSLDVHMGVDGLNFACTACHITKDHVWAGSRYQIDAKDLEGRGMPGQRRDVATCESCHGLSPHPVDSLASFKRNDHIASVACQTCHIPELARGGVATMTHWDWRTAGKTRDGEGYHEHGYTQGNGEERYTYKSIKGDFTYAENLVPLYRWFDGQMLYTTIDTKFDVEQQPIPINDFAGSRYDPKSRIWPFKAMYTWMPADVGNGTLVYNHLWGEDDISYWGNYNMGKAIAYGMERFGLDYSGQYGFVETVSYWPITHMVAPKEDSLRCEDCHAQQGRLAGVEGLYLPGRDHNKWLDLVGVFAVLATFGIILGHALIRLFSSYRGQHR